MIGDVQEPFSAIIVLWVRFFVAPTQADQLPGGEGFDGEEVLRPH